MIAPTVAHLELVRDDGQPLPFNPGQFIQVHFQYADGTPTKRSYSLATVRDRDALPEDSVEIAVSYVPGGAATALFEGLEVGERIDASGPFGRFCLMPNDANRRYLLIGTGTGVTPYRAMLPLLERQMDERAAYDVDVLIAYGADTPAGDVIEAVKAAGADGSSVRAQRAGETTVRCRRRIDL